MSSGGPKNVERFGLDRQWMALEAPEEGGRWCFPPLAASIAGAARLMLAMLERCVTDAGGSYVFCDTDSMAIVATKTGELVECPGGTPSRSARGLLVPRTVRVREVRYIGKESNRIEDVELGLVHDLNDVVTEYAPAGLAANVLESLRRMTKSEIAKATGLSGRQVQRYRTGKAKPRRANQHALMRMVLEHQEQPGSPTGQ